MSAKSKKRLCKLKNKFQKLENLGLKDVICSICQSILIEPVTLPCLHSFCHRCFNGSVENNALCCPLCRLRIGSWLRTTTKQNSLVNTDLWDFMKTKFSREIEIKLNGNDVDVPEEKPILRLSAPGEIRSEYEAELQKLRAERFEQEKKHIQETELLIEKIQKEEREAQKQYLERLKQDELLAQKIQKQVEQPVNTRKRRKSIRQTTTKLKAPRIDNYLTKIAPTKPAAEESPLLTDDASTTAPTPAPPAQPNSPASPELVPTYSKIIKNYIDKKIKTSTSFWNKDNGNNEEKEKLEENIPNKEEERITNVEEEIKENKDGAKSLLVSLPLPNSSVLQHKINATEIKNADNDSVDSMKQELCFFKPIEKTTSTSFKNIRGLPLKVPCIRATREKTPQLHSLPTRTQYLDGLCRLRQLSLNKNLPSAFVIALNILKQSNETSEENHIDSTKINNPIGAVISKSSTKRSTHIPNNFETNLRRTRSMGSITKENETTPKKIKTVRKKANSERKSSIRSSLKKLKRDNDTPSPISRTINNDKVSLAVKNLSSPLENCDVKQILQEQLKIEKMIEQEKKDLELARQMDAEWNGRRLLRRAPGKRQVTLNYALRPTKKMKA